MPSWNTVSIIFWCVLGLVCALGLLYQGLDLIAKKVAEAVKGEVKAMLTPIASERQQAEDIRKYLSLLIFPNVYLLMLAVVRLTDPQNTTAQGGRCSFTKTLSDLNQAIVAWLRQLQSQPQYAVMMAEVMRQQWLRLAPSDAATNSFWSEANQAIEKTLAKAVN